MKPNSVLSFVLAAAAAVVAGCAGGAGGAGAGAGGGATSSDTPMRSGPRAIESFPPQTQEFMKTGLHQFSQADPQWEDTRVRWLAMGPDEADFLVRNMWTALIRFQAINQPKNVERARHELAFIGEPAIPLLAAFLAGGTVYSGSDPETGERRDMVVDDIARREASEILGLIGAPAVPAVRDALVRAASKAGKRYALQTLGYIGDRGGAAAYEPLLEEARGLDDVLRVEAVVALRYFHDDTTRDALIQALSDPEDLVRRKAAESLRDRHDAASVASIRAAAERARGEAKMTEAAELERAAASIDAWVEKHPK